MSAAKNLLGQRFGALTVIEKLSADKHNKLHWLCLCDCGGKCSPSSGDLNKGHTTSCGCIQKQRASEASLRHGLTDTPEHSVWKRIRGCTTNPNHQDYRHYGGRGIRCNYESFEEFLADVGKRPTPGHTLDRKNVNGHYEPGNCRWATRKEQANNTRCNRLITYNGETLNLTQWAERLNVDAALLRSRLRYGWSVDRAFSERPAPGRFIDFNGQTKRLSEWAQEYGLLADTVHGRLKRNWPIDAALKTPEQLTHTRLKRMAKGTL